MHHAARSYNRPVPAVKNALSLSRPFVIEKGITERVYEWYGTAFFSTLCTCTAPFYRGSSFLRIYLLGPHSRPIPRILLSF